MQALDPKDILAEVEDLIRTMPDIAYGWNDANALDWLGRVRALMNLPQLGVNIESKLAIHQASSSDLNYSWSGKTDLQILLNQVRHTIRMQTVGPLAIAVNKGMVFDYFDGLKKILEETRKDILIVDPYIDADFVSRYFPFIAVTANIRILGSKHVDALVPAVSLYCQQHQRSAEVKKSVSLHDRYLFVDGGRGFQSGASFHQGGLKSPTALTEITDALDAIRSIYEKMWDDGTPVS